jgi:hypothetical protein
MLRRKRTQITAASREREVEMGQGGAQGAGASRGGRTGRGIGPATESWRVEEAGGEKVHSDGTLFVRRTRRKKGGAIGNPI